MSLSLKVCVILPEICACVYICLHVFVCLFVYVCTCKISEIYEALIVIWYTEFERLRAKRCGRKCYWSGLRNYSNSVLKVLKKIMQELILVACPQLGFETVTSWMWMRHVTLLTCLFCLVYSKCHNVHDLTMYPGTQTVLYCDHVSSPDVLDPT